MLMGDHLKHPNEVPSATRLVLMRDTFLSDWGEAKDKDCIYIYACDTYADAEIVAANARDRDDQDRISIQPGNYFESREMRSAFPDDWHVMLGTQENSARWYEPDAFSTEPCPECAGEGCEECDDLGHVQKEKMTRCR
jgi:hypothetical protein